LAEVTTMQHTLVIEIPEDVYEPLAKIADQAGKTPEEIAAGWLALAMQESSDDPLEKFIGTLKTTVPDWADEHDAYLGEALAHEARGERRKEG
jgi:hypothetical protein